MKENHTTAKLLNILNQVNSEEALDDFLQNHDAFNRMSFVEYINHILKDNNISKSTLIKHSGIQRTYAYQILKGIKKPSRDKLLAICLGAKMNLTQTQRSLTLAEAGSLYPKVKRDAIIIFAINNALDVLRTNDLLYEMEEDLIL
ncbi:MAG: helix-turn-helix domain-containing protein [Eubacteriales bacterium]